MQSSFFRNRFRRGHKCRRISRFTPSGRFRRPTGPLRSFEKGCAKIESLVSYSYPFRRKEGPMMTFPIPGDPQSRSVFLPDVSRS